MPNKDGTGPKGEGSKTGRQLGNCENREPQNSGQGRFGAGNSRRNSRGCGQRRCRRMDD